MLIHKYPFKCESTNLFQPISLNAVIPTLDGCCYIIYKCRNAAFEIAKLARVQTKKGSDLKSI